MRATRLTTATAIALLTTSPAAAPVTARLPAPSSPPTPASSGAARAGHRVFEGVPYARPPVGELRWRGPQPVVPWRGVRDATAPGPICAQVFTYPPGSPQQFRGGDPRRITSRGDVVVVTLNYRLGALGFLRAAELGCAGSTAAVLAGYPVAEFPSPGLALATLLTDEGRFQGTCRQLPFDAAARRGEPVYAYEYAQPNGLTSGDFPQGAPHGADVQVMFDSYLRPPAPRPEPLERAGERLIDHWAAFARTGDPGWPAYTGDGTGLSISAAPGVAVDLHETHRCAFWRALGGRS